MLPPPAPIVSISMCGTLQGTPFGSVMSIALRGRPSRTTPTSALVPPTSNVTQSRKPAAAASRAPPITPAAGPESTSWWACSPTERSAVAIPPLLCITNSRGARTLARAPPRAVRMYGSIPGASAALTAAVAKRGYSRGSLLTADERPT